MFIPFEKLPDHARIWIYQAGAMFDQQQEEVIHKTAKAFCEQWVAHGDPLRTSFTTDRGYFLILGVDEDASAPSGCSIDSSVHMLKFLKEQTGVDFLDRSRTAFLIGNEVQLFPISHLKEEFKNGVLGPGTVTFNTLAATKDDYSRNWLISAEKTWLARYLPKATIS